MKIIYARTQFWFNLKSGGSVGHTLGILNALKNNNWNIKIVSNEAFLGIKNFEHSIVTPRLLPSPPLSTTPRPKIKKLFLKEFFYNFYAQKKFKKEILEFKPDYIYHRFRGLSFFVSKIAKELNIPLILEFNSFDSWKLKYWKKGFSKYFFYLIVKRIENYNLKKAFLVVVVSEPLKDDLLKLDVPERKILINPNGVDVEKFNPVLAQTQNIKQKLGIKENSIIIGFSSTFSLWHGVPQLTEAIDKILGQQLNQDIHFLLIGDGPLKQECKNKIGHYKGITFTGEIPYTDIQNYLAICDILLSPHCPQIDGKEFFGSPTKLFEYMAMEKGIIASNLGQIGKVLENNKTAILVKPGDVDELVAEILKLAQDRELRKKLGRNAREEVMKNYTWQKNVERLIERLKNVFTN